VTTPHGYKPEASGMTLVCRPTPFVRFMHASEQSSQQLAYRMAQFWSTVVFFPTALRRGTQRNAIQLKTCTRTTQTFFCTVEKTERKDYLMAARLSSPRMHAGTFRRELGKIPGILQKEKTSCV